MNEKIAIDIIKQVPLYRYECELEKNRQSELFEALEMGIKALEKQIAKKPTIQDDFDYGEGYVCGVCESFLHYVVDDDEHYRTNYCLHCGQKLDWGNEDAE